jgi:hypothetical protein
MTPSARQLLQSATDATESKKATLCKASPMPDGSEAVVVTADTVSTPVLKMCGNRVKDDAQRSVPARR